MKTYQVTLPDEFAAFVDRMVAAGKWDTADDLFLTGVAAVRSEVEADEATTEPEREALRKAIRVGIDQLDRGEGIDGEEFMRKLIAKLEAAERQPS